MVVFFRIYITILFRFSNFEYNYNANIFSNNNDVPLSNIIICELCLKTRL